MAKLRYFKFYYFYKQAFSELNWFNAKKLILALIDYAEYGITPKKLNKKTMKYFMDIRQFVDMDNEMARKNGYLGSKKRWKNRKNE